MMFLTNNSPKCVQFPLCLSSADVVQKYTPIPIRQYFRLMTLPPSSRRSGGGASSPAIADIHVLSPCSAPAVNTGPHSRASPSLTISYSYTISHFSASLNAFAPEDKILPAGQRRRWWWVRCRDVEN